jgi:hypothetical protein
MIKMENERKKRDMIVFTMGAMFILFFGFTAATNLVFIDPDSWDNVTIITEDYLFNVGRGDVEGAYIMHKFGANDDVGASLVPVTIGGNYRTPQTAQTLEILSDDVDDSVTGTGARKVLVIGLNGSGDEIREEVEMDGTTPVTLTNDFLRVYRLYVTETGSYATQTTPSQQGVITLRGVGGGDDWAELNVVSGFGVAQSEIGVYTVPKGYHCYLLEKVMSVNSNKYADIYFFKRENITQTTPPYDAMRLVEKHIGLTGVAEIISRSRINMFPELTDIGFMSISHTGAEVSVEFELLCESNS